MQARLPSWRHFTISMASGSGSLLQHNRVYSIKRQIGKGSYGQVFLVTARDERKLYVMKNIELGSHSPKEKLGAEQEAILLSSLQHPNIVSYKDSWIDQSGVLHIVMGYCEGGDLCSRLKTCKHFLAEARVVEWFVQISLGLQYLHDRNILHRDLKTQNIFLSRNDIIKVGDLGIARVLDGSSDLAQTVVGTPYYMSPELFSDLPYNHKSDVWALGCCVYEIASLKQAFSAHNINALMYKIVQGKVPPLPSQYSRELTSLVHLMMAHNASMRPTVHQILRKAFIRKHIEQFLDHNSRKRKMKPQLSAPQQKPKTGDQRGMQDWDHVIEDKSPHQHEMIDPAAVIVSTDAVSSARQRRRRSKYQEHHGKKATKTLTDCGVKHGCGSTDVADAAQNETTDGATLESRQNEDADFPSDEEEAELCILLDSTLHLPKPDMLALPTSPLPSGTLQERSRALQLECEDGLGDSVVHQVMEFLAGADPEETEEGLLALLGVKNFELYSAKLKQLKLSLLHS